MTSSGVITSEVGYNIGLCKMENKIGDRFKVINAGNNPFINGDILTLVRSAESHIPVFTGSSFPGREATEVVCYLYRLEKLPPDDIINSPKHYIQGSVECIDAIQAALTEEQFIGFLRGNVIKYHWRLGNKDIPLQEVEKGLWYANKLKEVLQNGKL